MMKCLLVLSLVLAFSVLDSNPAPVEGPGRLDDLPNIEMFQPEKKQTVPAGRSKPTSRVQIKQ